MLSIWTPFDVCGNKQQVWAFLYELWVSEAMLMWKWRALVNAAMNLQVP